MKIKQRVAVVAAISLVALGCVYFGIVGMKNISYLQISGVQTEGRVTVSTRYGGTIYFHDTTGHQFSLQTDYRVPMGNVVVFYDPRNPSNAIVKGGGVWVYPMGGVIFGGLLLLFIIYLLWKSVFNRVPEGTDPLSRVPKWLSETRINRKQFWTLGLLLLIAIIAIGVAAELIFGDSLASTLIIIFTVIILFVGEFFISIFRLNDISPDLQLQLWKSGNMWLARGWMLWFAPSHKGGSSYHEVNSLLMKGGKANWSVIGHNAMPWIVLLAVVFIIVFSLYFLDLVLR